MVHANAPAMPAPALTSSSAFNPVATDACNGIATVAPGVAQRGLTIAREADHGAVILTIDVLDELTIAGIDAVVAADGTARAPVVQVCQSVLLVSSTRRRSVRREHRVAERVRVAGGVAVGGGDRREQVTGPRTALR